MVLKILHQVEENSNAILLASKVCHLFALFVYMIVRMELRQFQKSEKYPTITKKGVYNFKKVGVLLQKVMAVLQTMCTLRFV